MDMSNRIDKPRKITSVDPLEFQLRSSTQLERLESTLILSFVQLQCYLEFTHPVHNPTH